MSIGGRRIQAPNAPSASIVAPNGNGFGRQPPTAPYTSAISTHIGAAPTL